ncbi:MAG: KH domain-containing protein [Thermomicrobiales bacterium]|nr:KH domain-containing protein [Thermomicrobiales bacterium]
MATQLVENADDIDISVDDRGSSVHIMLRVPEAEMGRVIGRQGRIAKAMRTVVMIAGSRQNVRASLDIDG